MFSNKRVGVLAMCCVLLFGMVGCAPKENTPPSGYDSAAALSDYEKAGGYDADSTDSFAIPIEEIHGLSGAFVLNAEGSELDYLEVSETLAHSVVGWDHEPLSKDDYFSIKSGGKAAVIDRNAGERLVIVGEAAEYSSDDLWMSGVTDRGFWQGTDVAGSRSAYEEIEEVSVSDMDQVSYADFLSGLGLENHFVYYGGEYREGTWLNCDELSMLISNDSVALSAGWYKDTTWVDGIIPVETPYYFCKGGQGQNVAVNSSKDGYFEVDISALEPGTYYFDLVVGDLEYAVEIR